MDQWDVAVIGAGPAGLTAACRAALRGRKTLVLEKNRKPGVKILISGGGHCNLTHAADARGIVKAFRAQGRFLHSALAAFSPQQLVKMMESEGVRMTVLPNGKILPVSGRATDVLAALMCRVAQSGATVATDEPLEDVFPEGDRFRLTTSRRSILAEKLVLTTGGCSYPRCGTSGDGYRWAAALGHTVIPPRPALVPILTEAAWVRELQGITIPDVVLRVVASQADPASKGTGRRRQAPLAESRGSLLFAHFGLSGPVALDVSQAVSACANDECPVLECDFLPDLPASRLDEVLETAPEQSGRRRAASLLEPWLPQRLAEALVAQSQIPADRRIAELSRRERQQLVQSAKGIRVPTAGTLGFDKAEVTAGGVALNEVDSRTMESKLVPGLFIAGELLDLDGLIGGYNLQAAFSTGYLAGESV
ncbi:MAG: NAD(P)/FAD-dependent oxidoreductase [Planctomycetaceae bacterium]|nr:NAD(P)/FAD-dependent oxidoreductase [Planctomycetaceae bacterium]